MFLELMGGIKLILIVVVFLWLIGFFTAGSGNSRKANSIPEKAQYVTKKVQDKEINSSLVKESPKRKITPQENTLGSDTLIRNQVF